MVSLVYLTPLTYMWHWDTPVFIGRRAEIIAYGYWNFGIELPEIHKALKLLNNINNQIIFNDGKILEQNSI